MRLGKLVEDQRLVTDPPQGELQAEELEPLAVLEEAAESMRPRLQQAHVALEGMEQLRLLSEQASPRVRGDATRLVQVFLNLLENSARYTHPGGRVLLQARVGPGKLRITIDDSAPAPAASELPRLFERFYRAEASRSRATGGSGLGLAICRSIVQAQGGHISAHLSQLGGLRVELEFPSMAP
jgi:two-component system sensor histidine kinase BaeS